MGDDPQIDWFRKPTAEIPGTLNACYNALDRHVIKGRADEVAVSVEGREWTYAELLAEVGAFAGVLRAFEVGVGDTVLVGALPGHHAVVAALAVARLGAVRTYADSSADAVAAAVSAGGPRVGVLPTKVDVDFGDWPLITIDESSELSWDTVMRAGRTDPAGCADAAPDAVLAVFDQETITVLDALRGASPESSIDVGGLSLWVHP